MKHFQELGIKKDVLIALSSLKFKAPMEVQEKVIPLILQNKNVVFTSQTGSGKTFAYILGILGKLDRKKPIQVMIVVPTRELCIQIGKELIKLCDLLQNALWRKGY